MDKFGQLGSAVILTAVLSGCSGVYKITEGPDSLEVEKGRGIPLLLGVSAEVNCKAGKILHAIEDENFFLLPLDGGNNDYTIIGIKSCAPQYVAKILEQKGFKHIPDGLNLER